MDFIYIIDDNILIIFKRAVVIIVRTHDVYSTNMLIGTLSCTQL